jgi:hypothetical protein
MSSINILEEDMKYCISLLAFLAVTSPALANSDDDAWVKRCVSDNADQKQSAETVAVYCACMVQKMPSSETLSVTAWEKTHTAEQESCSAAAGWVAK